MIEDDIDQRATDMVMSERIDPITEGKRGVLFCACAERRACAVAAIPDDVLTNGKQHFFNPDFVTSLSKNHKGVETDPRKLIKGVQWP